MVEVPPIRDLDPEDSVLVPVGDERVRFFHGRLWFCLVVSMLHFVGGVASCYYVLRLASLTLLTARCKSKLEVWLQHEVKIAASKTCLRVGLL